MKENSKKVVSQKARESIFFLGNVSRAFFLRRSFVSFTLFYRRGGLVDAPS